MKTAIVYYSMSGNTKYTVEKIEAELKVSQSVEVIEITPIKSYPNKGAKKFLWAGKSAVMGDEPELNSYDFDSDKFDRIIICTPVWASTFVPPIKTFLKENPNIDKKKIAVVTCFSGGGADKAIEKLRKFIGVEEIEAQLILVDPKDKFNEKNNDKISEFCKALM